MKKIIACIKSEENIKKIAQFCEEERFALVVVGCSSPEDGDQAVLHITDDKSYANNIGAGAVPLCLISDDKMAVAPFNLKESFKIHHLRMLIDSIYHGNIICNYAPSVMPVMISKEFVLSNDYSNIDKIVCAITADLPFFFTFSDLEKIRVGMSEMITNAIEHGNLAITGHEKMESTEDGSYYKLLNKRLADPANALKKTYITIDYRNSVLTIKIKDDGKGFDTSKIPDPTDTERLLKLHGRGIFITRMYFDEIKYNGKGNEVSLIKHIN